ncbi:MAG: hypothetical protein LBQ44_08655 [Treponema sp.]|jgi:hypothetical protein|nr:hypothetical protein [Treponema sp.]
MVKKAGPLVLLALIALPLWSGEIAPPGWIRGQWAMDYEGTLIVITFLEDDILLNGESLAEMAASGYITLFRQQITETDYSVHVEYADGFWWEESFPLPSMTSVYIDKSHGEEQFETLTYRFIPLRRTPDFPPGNPGSRPQDTAPVPGGFN